MTERRAAASEIDAVLAGLPTSFRVCDLREVRFVCGPTGAFVVAYADQQLEDTASSLVAFAASVRMALAHHLTLVPFVDALLVTPEFPSHPLPATAVPTDLLGDVLTLGPLVLDDTTVARLHDVVSGAGWRLDLAG